MRRLIAFLQRQAEGEHQIKIIMIGALAVFRPGTD
jgi:hypothetical protein